MYPELRCAAPEWMERTPAEIGEFATRHRDELDRCRSEGRFPRDLFGEIGRRGWVGAITPREHGGLGGGVAEYCLIEEEVGRHGLVSPQISVQAQRWLIDWATPEQAAQHLPPLARGETIFSVSISEPGVGSSLRLMTSTARRRNGPRGDWVLSGHKTHVNLGHESDVTICFALAPEGLSVFLVDMTLDGVSTRPTDPIGLRLIPTADVVLDDVVAPPSALLGEPGRGMEMFLTTFNMSRLGNASELIGFGRRALAQAVDYGAQRQVADNVVTDFQGIQWTLADSYGMLYGAALARDRAARLADEGREHSLETTLAKKLAVDAAERSVNECFALVGGHGLYNTTDFGQLLHDVKVLRVAGGSLEVMRNYIARRLLRSDTYEGLK